METDASDLFVFATVMDAGSFSGAAGRLGLPKSTVSRRVGTLEQRLGEKLLLRTTRRLTLTEFGETVLAHARALAAEVDAARAVALHRQAVPTGRLRVSMPADVAALALSAALAEFVSKYPSVALELDVSPRRVDLVAEGYDLAIRMGLLPDDAQLAARRLAVFEVGLYAAPACLPAHRLPTTPDDLAAHHALTLLSRTGEARPWVLRRRAGGDPWQGLPPARTAVNSPDLLLRLARAGAGITAAAEFFARPYVDRGELVRVLPDWCGEPSVAWAVFPGRRLMPTKTRLLIDALAAALAPCNEGADPGA